MRRCLLVLLMLVAPCMSAMAQGSATGVLLGRVLDAQTGAPVSGVELIFAQRRVMSDSAGEYKFDEVSGGVYAISVRKVGYELLNQNIAVIVGAESVSDFRLRRINTLDTVRTVAAATKYISPALKGFEERKQMGNGYFIDEAVMRKSDNRTLGNTLTRIPGLRVSMYNSSEFAASSRRAGSGQAGSMLKNSPPPPADPSRKDSPRGCWVSVYLDGLAIYIGPPQPAPDLAKILVRGLAAAEFYQGGASLPAQFSAIKSSDCGVLLLWTRER